MPSTLDDLGFVPAANYKGADLSDLGFQPIKPTIVTKPLALDPRQQVQLQSGLENPENPTGQDNTFLEAMSEGGSPLAFAKNLVTLPLTTPAAVAGEVAEKPGADVLNAISGDLTGKEPFQPGKAILPAPAPGAQGIMAAIQRAVSPMTTPGGLLMLGAAPESKAVQAGFLASAAGSVPDQVQRIATAQTPQDMRDAAADLGLNVVMGALMAHGLSGEAAPEAPETGRTLPSGPSGELTPVTPAAPAVAPKADLTDLGFVPATPQAAPEAVTQPAPAKATEIAPTPKYPPLAQQLLSSVESVPEPAESVPEPVPEPARAAAAMSSPATSNEASKVNMPPTQPQAAAEPAPAPEPVAGQAQAPQTPDLRTIGESQGFTYDGIFPGANGKKLLQFTFRNLPKDDPAAGASFYTEDTATPEQIIKKAQSKAQQFRDLAQPTAETSKAVATESEEPSPEPEPETESEAPQPDAIEDEPIFENAGSMAGRAEQFAQMLEPLKTGIAKGGQLHAFGVPSLVWDTAISGAQAGIRAGGKVADAVAAAIKHIKDNFKGQFDEDGARDAITTAIRGPLRLDSGDNWQDLQRQRTAAAERLTKAKQAVEATRGKGGEGIKGTKGIKDETGALMAELRAAREQHSEINQKLLRSPGYIRSRVEAYADALKKMESARASGNPESKATARQALEDFLGEFEQMPSQVFAQVWKQMQKEGRLPESEQMPTGRSLQSLTDWLRSHDVDSPKVPLMEKLRLGERAAAAVDAFKGAYQKAFGRSQAGWEAMKSAMLHAPKDDDFRRTIKQWIEADTHTGLETREWQKELNSKVSDPRRRAGIAVWLDAMGDEDELRAQRADLESIGARRWLPAWDAALKLTDSEKSLARQIQSDFATKLEDGRNVGIIDKGRENYGVPQIWEKQPQPKERGTGDERNAGNPRAKLDPRDPFFALQRSVPSYFDGIMAGGVPKSLDVGALVGEYNRAFHKALSSRAVIWNLKDARAKDNTPVVKISGSARIEPLPTGGRRYLVDSSKRPADAVTADGRPYQPIDHWALRGWTYKGSTEAGSPVLVNGDFLVHPDHYEFLKNELMNSPLREGKVGKIFNPILKTAAYLKASKFSLGTFHLFTVAKNMASFGVNPFTNGFKLDMRKPEQALMVRNGLELGYSRDQSDFMEGLASGHGGIWGHFPGLGAAMGRLSDFIFKDYLPAIKMKVALKVMEDNRQRYGRELNPDQLAEISARAVNAGAGLQSYRLLGTSKLLMDLSRLAFVAPDFMLSEAKLFGGAATRYGAAQRRALLVQAITAYVGARAINAMLNNGNPHMELKNALSVVYKGRAYGIRLPIVDLWNFIQSPTQFASGRLGPVPRGIIEGITGRDMRTGVSKQTWTKYPLSKFTETFLRDSADWLLPAGAEGFLPGAARREQTPLSSVLAGQLGITSHQYTAQTQMWDAASKFNRNSPDKKANLYQQERDAEAQGESDYRGLDDLLRSGDMKGAKKEYQSLISQGHTPSAIAKRYQVYTDAGTLARPFTGNQTREREFTQSMTDAQRTTYREAIQERKDLQQKFRQMLQ